MVGCIGADGLFKNSLQLWLVFLFQHLVGYFGCNKKITLVSRLLNAILNY